MNLTLALLLVQNIGSIEDTDWTVNIITHISNRYFRVEGEFFIFHYYSETPEDFIMEGVMKNLCNSNKFLMTYYNLTSDEGELPEFYKPKGILLFIEFSKQSYSNNVIDFTLRIISFLNLNMRVIVILQHHKYVKDNDVLFLLQKNWNINVRNVIVINSVISDFKPAAVKIFYWRPTFDFKKASSIRLEYIHKITLSITDNQTNFWDVLKNETMFKTVDAEDIHGHYLNVSVAITPPYVWYRTDQDTPNVTQIADLKTGLVDGIEVYILKELSAKYNLTVYAIIHPPEILEITDIKDESKYTAFEETAVGISDIVIGGNLPSVDIYSYFGASSVYIEDNVRIYVQGAKEIPRWKNLYLIFHYRIWIFIAIVHMLASTITYMRFRSGRYKDDNKIDFSTAMMVIWATIVTQPLPSAVPGRMKLLFLAALFYGTHIATFYQSGLITILHKKYYGNPVGTIEQAKALNMTVCEAGSLKDAFDESNLDNIFDNNPRIITAENYRQCLDMAAKSKHVMALVPEKATEYIIPLRYLDENYMETIWKMRTRIIRFPVSMYLTKASPYKKSLDFVISGLLETGIIQKWWDDIRFTKSKRARAVSRDYNSISLRNMTGVFSVYILAMIISTLVFITEIAWFKVFKWRSGMKKRNNQFVY